MSENEKFVMEATKNVAMNGSARKSLELLIEFDDLEFSKMVLDKEKNPFVKNPLYLVDGSIKQSELWRIDSAFVCGLYSGWKLAGK